MALTDFLDLTLAVAEPAELEAFWNRRGLDTTALGQLGTPERPTQLVLREANYRHVASFTVACESRSDLLTISDRLLRLGVTSTLGVRTLLAIYTRIVPRGIPLEARSQA